MKGKMVIAALGIVTLSILSILIIAIVSKDNQEDTKILQDKREKRKNSSSAYLEVNNILKSGGRMALEDRRKSIRKEPRAKNRKEKVKRLEEIIKTGDQKSAWAVETKERVISEIEKYSNENSGLPKIMEAICVGEELCKFDFEHGEVSKAMESQEAIAESKMFTWPGPFVSTGTSSTRQQIYLIDRDYKFDGWDLVKRDYEKEKKKIEEMKEKIKM